MTTRCDAVVLRYGELFLKGLNRRVFEVRLLEGVRRALADFPSLYAERLHGRIWVASTVAGAPIDDGGRVLDRLACVFGISSLSLVVETQPTIESLTAAAVRMVAESNIVAPTRFAVVANRADKRFPMRSPEVSRVVAEACLRACSHLRVDLKRPDLKLGVEIGATKSFVFGGRREGAGGLPERTAGRVVLLLSGGIDSPVAGYLLARRGCELWPIYFHAAPYTSEGAREKVVDLARVLAKYHGPLTLTVVPYAAAQEAMKRVAPGKYLVVLYRRLMLRIAEALAKRVGADAIATGESLGQVASQTLVNVGVIEAAATIPVLRPVIGFDKRDTIKLAESIGTFATSTRPFDDCCSLFVPKHPETRARLADVDDIERQLDLAALERSAIDAAESVSIA